MSFFSDLSVSCFYDLHVKKQLSIFFFYSFSQNKLWKMILMKFFYQNKCVFFIIVYSFHVFCSYSFYLIRSSNCVNFVFHFMLSIKSTKYRFSSLYSYWEQICRSDDEVIHHLSNQHDYKIMLIRNLNSLTGNFFSTDN